MTELETPTISDAEEWAEVLLASAGISELRVLDLDGKNYFGFWDWAGRKKMAAKAVAASRAGARGVYATLNPVHRSLWENAPNVMRPGANGESTTDGDVLNYRFIPVDIDPIRESNTSSTDRELEMAWTLAGDIMDFLSPRGWPDPVQAMSGNGVHLLYPTEMPVSYGRGIQLLLQYLAKEFNTPAVKVDTSVWNPARIWRFYGTMARKGNEPSWHRCSHLTDMPDPQYAPVRAEDIMAIIGDKAPTRSVSGRGTALGGTGGSTTPPLNVPAWLEKHDIEARGPYEFRDRNGETGHKWLLRQCPINLLRQHGRHDKNGSDTAILQFTSGAVCFKCQHDRCQHIKWENLRHIYETIYREV